MEVVRQDSLNECSEDCLLRSIRQAREPDLYRKLTVNRCPTEDEFRSDSNESDASNQPLCRFALTHTYAESQSLITNDRFLRNFPGPEAIG